MSTIARLIAAAVMAAAGLVVWASPSDAVSCVKTTRLVWDHSEGQWFSWHEEYSVKDRVYLTHCSNGRDYVRDHRLSIYRPSWAGCGFDDIRSFRMDPGNFTGTNPGPVSWPCVAGKRSYVRWVHVGVWVSHAAADRCWRTYWVRDTPRWSDLDGYTNTRCLP